MFSCKVILESPVKVVPGKTGKGKARPLNLNQYRNNHFTLNNSIKVKYKEIMEPQVLEAFKGVTVQTPIRIDYHLFVGTHRKLDISNVLCIVDKCFQDVLVEAGIIPEDNYEHVVDVRYKFGGYDKGNDHCKIVVRFPEAEETSNG